MVLSEHLNVCICQPDESITANQLFINGIINNLMWRMVKQGSEVDIDGTDYVLWWWFVVIVACQRLYQVQVMVVVGNSSFSSVARIRWLAFELLEIICKDHVGANRYN